MGIRHVDPLLDPSWRSIGLENGHCPSMKARSGSNSTCSVVPVWMPSASRTDLGMTICPLLDVLIDSMAPSGKSYK